MPTGFFFLFFLQRVYATDGCAQRSETYCSGKLFVCVFVVRAYRTEGGKKKEGKKSKFVLYSYFRINHATCIFYAFFIYYYLLLDTFRFLFFYFNFFNFYMVILV